jgi:hypothetical protein
MNLISYEKAPLKSCQKLERCTPLPIEEDCIVMIETVSKGQFNEEIFQEID